MKPLAVCLALLLAVAGTTAQEKEKAPPDFIPVTSEPVLKKKADPLYPELAKAAGIQGRVWVKLWVDTVGMVHDVVVVKSDHEVLNQAAMDAARKFEFEPAKLDGKPISVWVSVPFAFKLAEKTAGADVGSLSSSMQGAIGCVRTLLSGTDVERCKSSITPDATAIIGTRYMPLLEAVQKWGTPKGLPNERGWKIDRVWTVMNNSADLATMVVRDVEKKSGASRYHTIVLCRSGGEEWQIRHWHTAP